MESGARGGRSGCWARSHDLGRRRIDGRRRRVSLRSVILGTAVSGTRDPLTRNSGAGLLHAESDSSHERLEFVRIEVPVGPDSAAYIDSKGLHRPYRFADIGSVEPSGEIHGN